MAAPSHARILILDFGAQYTQLIARRAARDARLLRDPSVRRRRRLRPRVRAEGHHPVGRPEQRDSRRARRGRPRRSGRWACRCSASATACRRWPRSWAAAVEARTVREFGYAEVRARGHSRLLRRHRGPAQRRRPRPARRLDEPRRQGHALPPGFKVIAQQRLRARSRRWPTRRAASTPCSSIPKSRTRSRARRSSRASCTTSAAARADWNMPDYVDEAVAAIRAQVGKRRGDPRPFRRRRLVGRRRADPPRDRRSADLRLRRPRPAAPERGRAGDGHLRAQSRRARRSMSTRPTRFLAALAGVADPEAEAQDHRPRVRRRVPARGGEARRDARSGWRRARSIPT